MSSSLSRTDRELLERALELAISIRESAPTPKLRSVGAVDVAMVQIAMGRHEAALRNLEGAKTSRFQEATAALVIANRAYCRAHLDKDLEKALEEAEEACRTLPDEGILTYVRGLVLHRLGREEEALDALERPLTTEPDRSLPGPGERPMILAEVQEAVGDAEAAQASLERAKKEAKHSPFATTIAERLS